MFDWLRDIFDGKDDLTPVQRQQRRGLEYRMRIRGGMTPTFLSPNEARLKVRADRKSRKAQRKMDKELLKALEKRR